MAAPFMSMSDLEDLKRYVQSNETGMRQAESTVLLHVAHSNLQAHFHEIRFDMHVGSDQGGRCPGHEGAFDAGGGAAARRAARAAL
jgi:hypothetical protein